MVQRSAASLLSVSAINNDTGWVEAHISVAPLVGKHCPVCAVQTQRDRINHQPIAGALE